jgi:nicotinamidase-related amidase
MLIDAATSLLLMIDMQERLLPAMSSGSDVERNCGILVRAAPRKGVPVVATEQYPKGLGRTVPGLSGLVPGDSIMEKLEFSCARNSAIMERLEATGRKQAVLCGIEAHVCVLQTAMDLRSRGFDVFVAIDACGSRRDESLTVASARLRAAGISVVTTEMVVFEMLETAGSSDFRELSKLIQ